MTRQTQNSPAATDVATESTLVGLLDGRLVPSTMPLLRPDDAGVTRGDGVFETTLVVDGEVRDLAEHLARLARSARLADLDLPGETDWKRGIAAVVDAGSGRTMALRLIATRGPEHGAPTCYVTGFPVSAAAVAQRTSGVRVLLLDRGLSGTGAAASPWLLTGAKTLSYAINMAALRYAAAHEADDVIFVGSDGAILEAPTASVVVARGRSLLTPPLDGVLESITTARLLAAARVTGWETAFQRLTPQDLVDADGVWLVSSVRLLAPVVSLDGVPRSDSGLTGVLLGLLGCG